MRSCRISAASNLQCHVLQQPLQQSFTGPGHELHCMQRSLHAQHGTTKGKQVSYQGAVTHGVEGCKWCEPSLSMALPISHFRANFTLQDSELNFC